MSAPYIPTFMRQLIWTFLQICIRRFFLLRGRRSPKFYSTVILGDQVDTELCSTKSENVLQEQEDTIL